MVRPPRFEPGSSAWQADVLDQNLYCDTGSSVLDYGRTQETIINTLIKLKNKGLGDKIVTSYGYDLKRIARECNLNNPEQVKTFIANAQTLKTKKPLGNATKNKYATAYDHYCKINGLQWEKPYYRVEENTPLIPTQPDVQAIIDHATKRYAVIFTIESEIGCNPEELHKVSQKDINSEQGTISIKGCKGHASGNYKLKQHTAEMLREYLYKHTEEYPFPNGHAQSQIWLQTRRRAYEKLHKSELLKIELRNLRNYSGERFYKSLPIRDPIAVMRHLRHKKLETTMHYIRAIVLDFDEDEQYISRTSTTIEEDKKLIENGFQYVTERDGTKLYRKRK